MADLKNSFSLGLKPSAPMRPTDITKLIAAFCYHQCNSMVHWHPVTDTRNFLHCKGSLPCSQNPTTVPYHEPDEPIHIFIAWSILILSLCPYLGFPLGFIHLNFLSSLMWNLVLRNLPLRKWDTLQVFDLFFLSLLYVLYSPSVAATYLR